MTYHYSKKNILVILEEELDKTNKLTAEYKKKSLDLTFNPKARKELKDKGLYSALLSAGIKYSIDLMNRALLG